MKPIRTCNGLACVQSFLCKNDLPGNSSNEELAPELQCSPIRSAREVQK